jgi:hypothetical protein
MGVLVEEINFLALSIIETQVIGILNKQYVICCGRLASSYSLFNVHGSVHIKNILIYVQQDATLHS